MSALLVGCQNTATLVATPSPKPSPHTAVTAAVIQPGEVPAGLTGCPGSGPIAGYLLSLQGADPALASRMTQSWQQLRANGALDAAIAVACLTLFVGLAVLK